MLQSPVCPPPLVFLHRKCHRIMIFTPHRPGNSSDMTTDYKVKFVQCLEPVLSTLSGAEFSSLHASCRQDQGEQAPPPPTATTTPTSYRSLSKSLPATPKHRASARVEFQTDFPEHCKMFDGHMKVGPEKQNQVFLDTLYEENVPPSKYFFRFIFLARQQYCLNQIWNKKLSRIFLREFRSLELFVIEFSTKLKAIKHNKYLLLSLTTEILIKTKGIWCPIINGFKTLY